MQIIVVAQLALASSTGAASGQERQPSATYQYDALANPDSQAASSRCREEARANLHHRISSAESSHASLGAGSKLKGYVCAHGERIIEGTMEPAHKISLANLRFSEDIWAGKGALTFFPSDIEEHMTLVPREIIGAYQFSLGYSFPGGDVLYNWV
jgi:hypothetical protein